MKLEMIEENLEKSEEKRKKMLEIWKNWGKENGSIEK